MIFRRQYAKRRSADVIQAAVVWSFFGVLRSYGFILVKPVAVFLAFKNDFTGSGEHLRLKCLAAPGVKRGIMSSKLARLQQAITRRPDVGAVVLRAGLSNLSSRSSWIVAMYVAVRAGLAAQ